MARFLLAVCAVAACAVVAYGGQLADIGRLSLLGPATTLSDPNPGAGAMTIEDDWGLAFNVLSQLNPDSPHLAGVDATDPAAVKVAVTREEQRLYDVGSPSVEAVADALFNAKPHLYFMQVGVHAEDPANDLIVPRVAAMAEQHGHAVSGLLVDPSQNALDAVTSRIQSSLARVPADSIAPTTAGVVAAPVAICSHNSKGVLHGHLDEDGEWVASYLPWRRDPDAVTKEVDCRTLPSLRRTYGIQHFDIMQVSVDGYEMEPLTGIGPSHPHLIWYRHLKLNPSHTRFLERKFERVGYRIQYDERGFAWGWFVNPENRISMARSRMTQGLAPGIERVEAPLEQFGRWTYAPVMATPAPPERRYVMHGEFQRMFCYYIVLSKPQRVKELLVTFGSTFKFPDKVVVEGGYDPMDPRAAEGGAEPDRPRVYPVRSTHANSEVRFQRLGDLMPLENRGGSDAALAPVHKGEGAGDRRALAVSETASTLRITRLRLRCDASIKEVVGPLALHAVTLEFVDDVDATPAHGEL